MRALGDGFPQIRSVFGRLAVGGEFGAGCKVDGDEGWTLEMEDGVEAGFIVACVVKIERVGETAGESDFLKIHRARAGNVLVACHFVGVVLRDKEEEVASAALGDAGRYQLVLRSLRAFVVNSRTDSPGKRDGRTQRVRYPISVPT